MGSVRLVLILTTLTAARCVWTVFGTGDLSSGSDASSNAAGDTTEPETDPAARHTAIVYFCLFSLLLLHMGCVVIACMLCFRHALNNSTWCGRRAAAADDTDPDTNNANGSVPEEDCLAVTKSMQKDLNACLDRPKSSPYRLEFVHHENCNRRPVKVPYVGYNLQKVNPVDTDSVTDEAPMSLIHQVSGSQAANPVHDIEVINDGLLNPGFSGDSPDHVILDLDNSKNINGAKLRRSETTLPDRRTLDKIRGSLSIRNKNNSTRSLKQFLNSVASSVSAQVATAELEIVAKKAAPSWTCPICLIEEDSVDPDFRMSDDFCSEQESLPCSHTFHMCCIADLLRYNLKCRRVFTCPMCRKKFSVSMVKKVP